MKYDDVGEVIEEDEALTFWLLKYDDVREVIEKDEALTFWLLKYDDVREVGKEDEALTFWLLKCDDVREVVEEDEVLTFWLLKYDDVREVVEEDRRCLFNDRFWPISHFGCDVPLPAARAPFPCHSPYGPRLLPHFSVSSFCPAWDMFPWRCFT